MPARKSSANPPELEHARRRIARWRQSRLSQAPIPEQLWALAASVAREHGLSRTARVLALDYYKLGRLVRGRLPVPVQSVAAPAPAAFVEFVAPAALKDCAPCHIHIEGARGRRMKIEVAAAASVEVLRELGRQLWEGA